MSPDNTYLLEKARNFCSYQERCIYDVKMKLMEWKATDKTIEKLIRQLEEEDYINEERYAVSFATGKLRNNKWGRNKIFYALMQKHIPELYVQMGLSEIDEKEYIDTLRKVIASKKVKGEDDYKHQAKQVRYAVQKGFQPNLAWKVVKGEV